MCRRQIKFCSLSLPRSPIFAYIPYICLYPLWAALTRSLCRVMLSEASNWISFRRNSEKFLCRYFFPFLLQNCKGQKLEFEPQQRNIPEELQKTCCCFTENQFETDIRCRPHTPRFNVHFPSTGGLHPIQQHRHAVRYWYGYIPGYNQINQII